LRAAPGPSQRAGKINGQQAAHGIAFPLADLLIGVTALEVGYSVLTTNLRNFQLIPGLQVVSP
jgi:predicted nucleic acid-binding protein